MMNGRNEVDAWKDDGVSFFFFGVSVGPKGRGKGRDDGVAVNNCM